MTESDQTSIYIMKPDGSNLTKVIDLPSQFTGFSWSPDEQYIIYTPKNDGAFSALLVNVETKEEYQISEDISGISWSPDGKQVVYIQVSKARQKTMNIIDINGDIQQSFTANNAYNDSSPLWVELK